VTIDGSSASTLKDYAALKTKLATASPSSTSMDAYTPSNTAAACPAVATDWAVNGDALPPTPDSALCECMYSSLSCVPASGLNTSSFGDMFGFVCGADSSACSGISGNTSTGVYGAYSMCNTTQQLGYVLDAYYKNQNSDSSACDFSGKAVVNSAASTASSCSAKLASASSANNVAATATAASSGSASSSSFARPMTIGNMLTMGDFAVGLYVLVAMGVGAGMVLL
jgi:1,3-beta-glucanosyltransferase GAS1